MQYIVYFLYSIWLNISLGVQVVYPFRPQFPCSQGFAYAQGSLHDVVASSSPGQNGFQKQGAYSWNKSVHQIQMDGPLADRANEVEVQEFQKATWQHQVRIGNISHHQMDILKSIGWIDPNSRVVVVHVWVGLFNRIFSTSYEILLYSSIYFQDRSPEPARWQWSVVHGNVQSQVQDETLPPLGPLGYIFIFKYVYLYIILRIL